MPGKQKLAGKQKLYCRHCKQDVTTETFKAHLQLQKGLPQLPKPKRNRERKLMALRRELSRRSSQQSIDAYHCATAQPEPTFPTAKQLDPLTPNHSDPPDSSGYMELDVDNALPPIIEVDMDEVWDRIRQARPYALVDLPEETISQTRTYVTTEDYESTGNTPSVLSTDSEEEIRYNPATCGLAPGAFVRQHLLVKAAKQAPHALAPDSREIIMDFNFFVQQKTSVRTHEALREAYCRRTTHTNIPSLKEIRRQMLALSALKPVEFHCCRNSCVCFTGYLNDILECPYCHSPCLNPAGAPYAVFSHIPLTPQLLVMFRNPLTYEKLLYRSRHLKDSKTIKDVFDGLLYEYLCKTCVSVDGKRFPFKHFEDFRELALMLMLDGMAPFKKRKHLCWPIIIINLNLAPNICMHQDNIICIGAIPGPHSPKDINSFLQPLVDKLAQHLQDGFYSGRARFSLEAQP
ncbi:hypothetical protein RSOLAG1IB_12422 [Rhizoctonia solani AG-1 IB]|uniref:Uncharacterized protein n=1 Tax=Thanatephorus cucumeris (strain AG1-IB / isolate 7/3/14) TaxID=1108050 RepID=A0A0B7FYN9_THACB|nr:hypothetical protein RSOLAG1IB_12422 [Rhizoctonia solani AG-1 IB]